ncbi:MAG: hypothetical protein M1142_02110 [Patescibacteria group bacterium]|nr:hypothetical protein [Patescibacteria group bacterium]
MGKEQGTSVSSSIIDLPPQADLTDPRLPRAFRGWTEFSLNHTQQLSEIGTMKPMQVVLLAEELSSTISKAIGVGNEGSSFSSINEEKLVQLTDIISGKGNRVIFMRHGEQSPPEWIFSLADPGLRKIRMMRDPFNKQDLLTNNGLVDVFVTALALLHTQVLTGRRTRIFSSENVRAKEVAYIISTVISGSVISTLEGLNCITYKDEVDQPPVTEEDLLADLPSGVMPWNPQLVDKLCKIPKSGMSQSEVIINTISSFVEYADRKNGNKLAIVVTHNQQVAEVLREAGKLEDSAVRFPELTMLITQNKNNLFVLKKGVLSERPSRQPKTERSMRMVLEVFGDGYDWYKIRREEYHTEQKIPFRVSPSPLNLSPQETQEILRIGRDIVEFIDAADELYRTDGDLKELLDRGKPDLLKTGRLTHYLFVRPDVIITQGGFSVCEIETSPFGLALAELLNRAYRFAGFETLVSDDMLTKFMRGHTPNRGSIVYSQHTASYAGQLQFLADKVLSGNDRKWCVEQAGSVLDTTSLALYRAFYQHECLDDPAVNNIIQLYAGRQTPEVIPSFTPHMEEKALLALIWDKRWEAFFAAQLGASSVKHLRKVIPPTWIIGQERFFSLGLPDGIELTEGLASLSKSKRNFVLKKSGFGNGSSWAEGVNFLQEKSVAKTQELLHNATEDSSSLYIIQEFRKAEEHRMFDEGYESSLTEMAARIRITPYFSMTESNHGQLLAIKATGCEKTNYIHASTGSINTAVA